MGFVNDAMALAAQQHGVVAWRQLVAAGYGHDAIEWRIRTGLLARVTPRVLTVTGMPDQRGTRAMIAVLDVGDDAVLSHTAAAAWWRISGFRLEPIHVSVERNRRWHRRAGIFVHHATVVPPTARTRLDGIPITTPAMTLLHLAGRLSVPRLAAAVDSAWSLRLVDHASLDAILQRMARRGRNGIVNFRKVLEERPEHWSPPHSNLESRFLHLSQVHSLGRFRAQVPLEGPDWSYRVDFLDRDLPLVVEVQSQRYHAALTDRERDRTRRRRIESLGYTVIEIWDTDLFFDEQVVADKVRRQRRRLLATTG